MGATKSDQFSQKQNELAGIAKAMGHPARIAIIEHLLKANACVCGELVDILPLSQPTVSQHLKELKQTELIVGETEGNSICYCLNLDTWNKFLKWVSKGEKMIEQSRSCC